MELKTNKALDLFRAGNLKEALAIFRTFRIGYTKDERRTLQIAHESLCGHSQFYQNLGLDTQAEIEKSKEIIETKYPKI